ncbi:hypothetical protein Hanom_Chr00s010650g01746311 [Helianthus anomalus]
MADSVDGAPPDSWEVADVDAAVSTLMLSSKRESNNSSPILTTGSSSEINSDLLAPVRSSSGGFYELGIACSLLSLILRTKGLDLVGLTQIDLGLVNNWVGFCGVSEL